jgi:hypothetical protein
MRGYAAGDRASLVGIIGWQIWGATHVKMAQIAQHDAVFRAHTTRKVRVVQMLIARELGHILENAQTLLDGFLSLRRQSAPIRQHFIFNVIALLLRHLLPDPFAVAHVLLLLRRQLPKALLIL